MSFHVVVDSKTSTAWSNGKLISSIPNTLFFLPNEWEIGLVSLWFSKESMEILEPLYIRTSVIDPQIVGDGYAKNLCIAFLSTASFGDHLYSAPSIQYRTISKTEITKFDFLFHDSMGKPIEFKNEAHVIMNLVLRKKVS